MQYLKIFSDILKLDLILQPRISESFLLRAISVRH